MKTHLLTAIFGLLFLAGCTYDFVSVSRDGTIALTLDEDGDFEAGEGCVYLTNANADFLTKIEEMGDCICPQISPSGKSIVALCDKGLILYDRESKKRRIIYPGPKSGGAEGPNFPAWAPDEKKVAFLVGDPEDNPPDWKLYVYDVKRRELEVLARQASPRMAWLPDSKRLLFLSFPPDASSGDAGQFGDLKMTNLKTGKQKTLARRQMLAYSKIAVFPEGTAALFPCVTWDEMKLSRRGIEVPLGLKKQLLPRPRTEAEKRERARPEEETPHPEEPVAKPDAEVATPGPTEEMPEEEGFFLTEGQPLCYVACAVSPDGKKIAYVRYLWDLSPDESERLRQERTQRQQREEVEGEAEEPEEEVEEDDQPKGLEFCVANADGTDSISIHRAVAEDLVPQVLWLTDTRLLCLTVRFDPTEAKITLVDADGKKPFDLIQAIKTRFADQFRQEAEEGVEVQEKTSAPETE